MAKLTLLHWQEHTNHSGYQELNLANLKEKMWDVGYNFIFNRSLKKYYMSPKLKDYVKFRPTMKATLFRNMHGMGLGERRSMSMTDSDYNFK